jgi:hypothetical protein
MVTLNENEIRFFLDLIVEKLNHGISLSSEYNEFDSLKVVINSIYNQDSDIVSEYIAHGRLPDFLIDKKPEPEPLTLRKLKSEVEEKYFNVLCTDVTGSSVFRVVGVAEDEWDFYYIIKTIKGEKQYMTAAMALISLKNLEEYEAINAVHQLNGSTLEKEILVEVN